MGNGRGTHTCTPLQGSPPQSPHYPRPSSRPTPPPHPAETNQGGGLPGQPWPPPLSFPQAQILLPTQAALVTRAREQPTQPFLARTPRGRWVGGIGAGRCSRQEGALTGLWVWGSATREAEGLDSRSSPSSVPFLKSKEIPEPTGSPVIRSMCSKFKTSEGKNHVNNKKCNTKQSFSGSKVRCEGGQQRPCVQPELSASHFGFQQDGHGTFSPIFHS